MDSPRRIAVLGSGYVGLTVAAGLAFMHHEVVCSDIAESKIDQLSSGVVSIVEDGLTDLILEMVAKGRLKFTTSNLEAVSDAEFVFLCLPTPQGRDGSPDITATLAVAREIGPHLTRNSIVINKSTVPVGTAHRVRDILNRHDVEVVSNPEFLSEGSAVLDFLQPDRIVIGSESPEGGLRVAELYGEPTDHKCIVTDTFSAELIKYACNAYLATRLTFINTMAELCEAVGADIRTVAAGMGTDHRIGTAFLNAGPGWGGSCFPKDTEALIHMAETVGCDITLIKTVVSANSGHTERIVEKVAAAVGGNVTDKVVAVWGLAFKAGTNDLRNSPALNIVTALQERGAIIRAYDPAIEKDSLIGIELVQSKEDACVDADVLLVATEWPDFSLVDLATIGGLMSHRSIVDARNIISIEDARNARFDYVGVGVGVGRSSAIRLSDVEAGESRTR
ncbi:MAG: UDP-glucose/GDP-mannose dehydrogenase family protein [Acidimicrobiales bacterium]